MTKKGQLTTSDYFPIYEFIRLLECLNNDKLYKWELYCRISFYTALRASDVLSLTWHDLLNRKELMKIERKTTKGRRIKLDIGTAEEITSFYQLLGNPDINQPFFCNPKTGKAYGLEYINKKLKRFRVKYRLEIQAFSTHTFRKTFARNYFETENCSTEAILTLKELLNHADISTTSRYIGLKQDRIDQAYYSAYHALNKPSTMS